MSRLFVLALALLWGGQAYAQYNPRLYTPQRIAQKSLNLPNAKQERFSLGTGEARANYIEESYPLDKDFSGTSWEYMEQLYHGKNGGGGWVTSWSLLDTRFAIDETDERLNRHDLQAHLLSGIWGLGLSRQLIWSNDYLLMFGADLYLGIGLLQFRKTLTNSGSVKTEFGERYGFDVVTGWDSYILMEFEESWIVGWKRTFYRNKLRIEYSDELAFLTHIESTLFFLGRRFGQVSCVATQYVPCP